MKYANIKLGKNVNIDPSSSFNNVKIDDNVKIAKRCSIYGSEKNILEIGAGSQIGMNVFIEGFEAKVILGKNVGISPNAVIISGSGPGYSPALLKLFPEVRGEINIKDNCWIGIGSTIMPNVTLGEFTVVAVNSFVNKSFPGFSIIGGNPAKVIREFTEEEIAILNSK